MIISPGDATENYLRYFLLCAGKTMTRQKIETLSRNKMGATSLLA